ncbi:MAG TPA: FtsX-like permease family protein [Burkholderiaceae bacterium]|nr:FtsX-like permease family protein [Burkholderiaceae bacterium]
MKTLTLALRNLLRNARRSLTTLLAMIVGLVAVLLFGGYIRDINYGLQTEFVQRSGHLQLQRRDYFLYGSGNPAAWGIADYRQVIETLQADPVLAPMLRVTTPTLQLGGIAGNFGAGVSRTVFAAGVVVDDQNRLRTWNDYRFAARPVTLALTGTPADSVVIGSGVARVLQLCEPLAVSDCRTPAASAASASSGRAEALPDDVAALSAREAESGGEAPAAAGRPAASAAVSDATAHPAPRIEMLAASARGAPNVASLRVVKAENQGVKELDDMYVGMHLAQAQQLVYGAQPPQVTAIVLQLAHTAQMPAARERLQALLTTALKDSDLEVQDFGTLNPFYGQTLRMFAAVFGFVSVLIGAIVLFTVGNTMSMAVVERTVEIGTLRAIGLRRAGIRRLFLCEGLLLGIGGVLFGTAVALVLAALINHGGLTWTPPGRVSAVPLTVHVWGETRLIVTAAAGLLIAAVLSALLPAARAARSNIVEALRHV